MANTYKGLKSTITGETMIFRNDKGKFPRYSTSFSQKVKDSDEWENGWMDVQFKRDVSMENKTKINITDGWLKFNISDGKTYWKIFVNAFDVVGEAEKYEGFAAVTDAEDLPF